MAAGPRSHTSQPGTKRGDAKERMQESEGSVGGVMGSLRVVELQLVAFIIVFSASGLVPVQDLVFPVFLSAYAFILSAMVFPSYGGEKIPDVFKGNRLFQLYVVLGTAMGLFLPLAYVLGGFARGDQQAVRDAAPHLFLLSFQILSENVISGLGIFSLPVRSLLPILYTTRRLFALGDWIVDTWTHEASTGHGDVNMAPMIPVRTELSALWMPFWFQGLLWCEYSAVEFGPWLLLFSCSSSRFSILYYLGGREGKFS